MSKKSVITGGAGFIGSNLAAELVSRGHDVHIVDRDYTLRGDSLPKEAIHHMVDIRNEDLLVPIFEGADVIYHTAAVPRVPYSVEHPVETTDNNITGTVSVLAAAVRAKARRVVFSSSGSTYGDKPMPFVETMSSDPVHPYGLQKFVGELFMEMWPALYGIETVCLRYFNVYGPGLDPEGPYALAIGKFLLARKNNEPITIFGDGTITRDFTHVSDVVRANIQAGESLKVGKGEVINIGSGKNITIQKLAEMFGGEIKYGAPRIEAHDALANIQKAKELLDWEPTIYVEEGVEALKKEWSIG